LDPKEPKKSTLDKPERPLFTEYYAGATRYSDLNQTEQKSFINARYIYETDLKEYTQQTQKIQEAQNKIQLLISDAKKALLSIDKSTREWLRILMDRTKPTVAIA
jgi:di/tripeptidase